MTQIDPERIKHPAGPFRWPEKKLQVEELRPYIDAIEAFPAQLRAATRDFTLEQWETKTLPGNWTVAQVVHHIADSHINSFSRFKRALTEEHPTISPYEESSWAACPDARIAPATASLGILDGLHARWTILLRDLDSESMHRLFHHPEVRRDISLAENTTLYAWHGRHHLGHIELLKESRGW